MITGIIEADEGRLHLKVQGPSGAKKKSKPSSIRATLRA